MRQRVSVVTLGAKDAARARALYEVLGWRGVGGAGDEPVFLPAGDEPVFSPAGDEPVFFPAGEMTVALWDRASLVADSCVTDGGGWGGVTVAHCVRSADEVDAITQVARQAGAAIGREPAPTSWGGYSSIVIDSDGHPWEIAYNPGWQVTAEGGAALTETPS